MNDLAKDAYKKAGVNINKADNLVKWLKDKDYQTTKKKSQLGDFAAFFPLDTKNFKSPTLVSSTDGVGTKLLLALEHDRIDTLGADLVAMCVNDLYTSGAKPLFFLDYYASSQLDSRQFQRIITSIKDSVELCGCKLLGGETAELPGLYKPTQFDLAGFVVGIVEQDKILGAAKIKSGDLLFALSSSGFHSNGYSLLRSWLKQKPQLATQTLVEKLLQPTVIYHKIPQIIDSLATDSIHGICHVTGGGVSGNLARIIPEGLQANIDLSRINTPTWMKDFLQEFSSQYLDFESVFNLGAGMIIAVAEQAKEDFLRVCNKVGYQTNLLGHISKKNIKTSSSVSLLS
jgi:phosphoribosylformylglycinamidine cyclo-ligase